MPRRPEVCWSGVIDELRGYGCSLRAISGALGLAHSTVQKWQKGACPNYEDGKALMQLLERTRDLTLAEQRISSGTVEGARDSIPQARLR